MRRLRALVIASHALPTIAVTSLLTVFAWSIGWRGSALLLVATAVLVGQLSVGWSNDAFDAATDERAQRREKPTVAGSVTASTLWACATTALITSSLLSWWAAGLIGGSFHVFAVACAWIYNVRLSRTSWSWLPYALAFGALPPFLYLGLDGSWPPWWTIVVFAVVAVSAHLANAMKDLESDSGTGLGGLAIRLGARRSALLCWVLLGVGTALLVSVAIASDSSPWTSAVLVVGYLTAILYATFARQRSAMFMALLTVVALDVIALITSPAL